MRKKCKSALSVIIAIAILLGTVCCSFTAFAKDGKLKFALATDIHIDAQKTELDVNYPESELYFHASGSGNLYDEAAGLTKSFLKQAAEQNVDFVLIPGDLTRSGSVDEHTFVSDLLRSFIKETGIPVYVVPGNHDYKSGTKPEDFKKYYSDISYCNALAVDTETASYTADLPDGYRLIAVDSNDPGNDGDGITDRLLSWIDTQVAAAKADGREIIYTMHHALLEHLPLGRVLMKDFVVRDTDKLAERFCEWGIQYTFTGHEHGNDISKFTGKNGRVVYDILTTSLSSYPLEYRMVTYSNSGVNIEMQSIDRCDFSGLIDGYNDKQLALMKSDYTAYAYGLFKYSIEKKVLKYVSPDFLKNKLKLEDGILSDEIDAVLGLVVDTLNMSLYDSGDGSQSIEALAAEKGIKLPKTDYRSMADLVSSLVALHYHGDENLPCNESPEGELLIKSLNTGLEYIISNVGSEALTALIPIADEFLPEYSAGLKWWFTAASYDREDSYKAAEQILYPIFDKFTHDTSPSDRDITLPAIGETVTMQERVMAVMEKIWTVIKYILTVVSAFVF